ncbi:MAG TPA: tRNA-intron lyase [Candidatus Bathyarchaeota archaeon]|nr:tRNA-intron lyase [Candidatus Bathyarchaeota archaeon]
MANSDKKKERKTVKKPIEALFRDDGVLVKSAENVERLSSRGYGVPRDGTLLLTFYEAMYLYSRGLIEVKNEKTGKTISFQDLLKKYESIEKNAWVKYLIYRDLRSRGYVVREGFGLGADFRLYGRGEYGKDSADYIVYGIYEGLPLSIEDLAQILKRVQNLKKTLILAVINRRGEIVYYSLSRLSF